MLFTQKISAFRIGIYANSISRVTFLKSCDFKSKQFTDINQLIQWESVTFPCYI